MTKEQVKAAIESAVNTNGTQAITGESLKETLITIVDNTPDQDQITAAYLGVASPSSTPPATGAWWAVAGAEGTYTNWSGIVVSAADLDIVSGVANNRVILDVNNGVATKRVERVKGGEGLSAYEVAVANGFIGTEAEWLASLTPPLDDVYKKSKIQSIGNEPDSSFAAYASNKTFILPDPVSFDGYITEVVAKTNIAGVVKFGTFSRSGNDFTLKTTFDLSLTSLVPATSTNAVEAGDYIGYITDGTPHINLKTGAYNSWEYTGDAIVAGTKTFTVQTNYIHGIKVTIKSPKEEVEIFQDEVNAKFEKQIFRKVGKIVSANFRNSTIPANWLHNGFTATIDGMNSAGGGINTYVEYDFYQNLDSHSSFFRFDMNSFANVFLVNYNKKYPTAGGHITVFDFVDKSVRVHAPAIKGALPSTILSRFALPWDPVLGDTTVKYERNGMKEKYHVQNGTNYSVFEVDTQMGLTTSGGYDKFGLVMYSGNITITDAAFGSQMPSDPDVLILGDSIVNGDTIRLLDADAMAKRWAGQVADKTLTSIVALGGNTTADFIRDNALYLSLFNPKKVVLAFGINDTVFATATANMNTIIAAWEAKGAEVILITLHPRADRIAYCTDFSNWVKSSGKRFIDYRRALTVDGAGVTNIPELFIADMLHPNVAGHQQIANEAFNVLEI